MLLIVNQYQVLRSTKPTGILLSRSETLLIIQMLSFPIFTGHFHTIVVLQVDCESDFKAGNSTFRSVQQRLHNQESLEFAAERLILLLQHSNTTPGNWICSELLNLNLG